MLTTITPLPPFQVGILGFARAIAGPFMAMDGIRVNAVCPGAMRTTIVSDWSAFDEDLFTPLDMVADLVLRLASISSGDQDQGQQQQQQQQDFVDSRGARVPAAKCYGVAVVANGRRFYVQEELAYCDDVMARTMEATKIENQAGDNWKSESKL